MSNIKPNLSASQQHELFTTLKSRFEKNMRRHEGLDWANIQAKLEANTAKLWSLNEMETTGGEPDVVGYDAKSNEYLFADCATETPAARRNLCYDQSALDSRKKFKPADSAANVAEKMGIELLTEEQYYDLQKLGSFDTKTSSWLLTPQEVRKLGGALFADKRYGKVFTYHNGAESYYGSRGFRGMLRL